MHPLAHALEVLARGGPLGKVAGCLDRDEALALGGVAGSTSALVLAWLLGERRRDLLVVVPDARSGHDLVGDLATATAALVGEGEEPIFLPSLDADPYSGVPAHPDSLRGRVRALTRLIHRPEGRRAVLVAPSTALAVPLPPPQTFAGWIRVLRRGEDVDLAELRQDLAARGYLREDAVGSRGEFASRGYILDVFPADAEVPLRLELFGDTLTSIRPFDPATQRSVDEERDRLELPPMREYAVGAETHRSWAEAVTDRGAAALAAYTDELEREGTFAGYELLHWSEPKERAVPASYLDDPLVVVLEPEACRARLESFYEDLRSSWETREERALPPPDRYLREEAEVSEALADAPIHLAPLGVHEQRSRIELGAEPAPRYEGDLARFLAEAEEILEGGGTVGVLLERSGSLDRFVEILGERGLGGRIAWRPGAEPRAPATVGGGLLLGLGELGRGFRLQVGSLLVLADRDLHAGSRESARSRARPAAGMGFLTDLRELKEGDFVVHTDHGIGRYRGIRTMPGPAGDRDFLIIEYRGDDKLYQPLERLDLVQKYSGVGEVRPKLDRMGGASWKRVKSKIQASMREMTKELLELYARRMTARGHAFSPDQTWQREFEDAFPYEETPDQARAIQDVKADMEAPRPMDRLVVGDVGFGKTEVAMRAAMKAVLDGRQVAVLAPTTVLAFQHWRTFGERFSDYPVRIELLSRFRTRSEQKETLEALAAGSVDIVVGTHRLLGKDVKFKQLGLLVVDEEQRFGVRHKERIKTMKGNVDVLTMTATPIPRTLQMAMGGLRDLSLIRTPPPGRYAIRTEVVPFRRETVAAAIRRELEREGQVYFVHNRVQSIHSMAAMVQEIAPEARVLVSHGQMPESELEETILAFVRGEADILVTTTIIENGVDIPRVNTIIVNRADHFGLAQLYQLRGRVGRSSRQAWAWLLVPGLQHLSDVARKRLRAIKEFSRLGSGFRLAAMDLEIRGAGNLLGPQQSGHIAAVGFEMYVKLLEQTAAELRGEELPGSFETKVSLPHDLHVPETYVPEEGERLAVYKRIVSARSAGEIDEILEEVADRWGHPPEAVENLALTAKVRLLASRLHVDAVEGSRRNLVIRFPRETKADLEALVSLLDEYEDASFSPEGILQLPVPDSRDSGALALEVLQALD